MRQIWRKSSFGIAGFAQIRTAGLSSFAPEEAVLIISTERKQLVKVRKMIGRVCKGRLKYFRAMLRSADLPEQSRVLNFALQNGTMPVKNGKQNRVQR
jgi:hypothetical protein